MKTTLLLFTAILMFNHNLDYTINNSISSNSEQHHKTVYISKKNNSQALDDVRTVLYKGTLNESTIIWLYLNEQESSCGGDETMIHAMYKYDNQDKWLLLDVTQGFKNNKLCMVENNFTGILLLEESGNNLNGNWISPNAKKQFKVELQKVELNKAKKVELEEILYDDLLYNKNDC